MSKSKDDVRNDILGMFRKQRLDVGHVFDNKILTLVYMPKLNRKEQGFVNDVINSLIEEKIVNLEQRVGQEVLVLTEKGFNTIY